MMYTSALSYEARIPVQSQKQLPTLSLHHFPCATSDIPGKLKTPRMPCLIAHKARILALAVVQTAQSAHILKSDAIPSVVTPLQL